MKLESIQPPGWAAPKGYSNGVLAPAGARLLCVAGQVAWDAQARLVGPGDFAQQFRTALANVIAVVRAAGGGPEQLMQLTIYVTDKRAYLGCTRELGVVWKELVGRHYPAMALVEVAGLIEEGALVEIQALAALP
ncbi:MAG: RidA family protein [Planctomycetes bacterium]|nr:RidA family protein [Planctomycetota bacterium]